MGARCTPNFQGEQNLDMQSHTHRAHPHTHSVEDKTLTTLVQCVRQDACSHFFVGMGAVTDQKANTSLTALNLQWNNVGDAGATALADALKAAVLTCKKCVFRARVRCHRKFCFRVV